jgi:hypothetical protein
MAQVLPQNLKQATIETMGTGDVAYTAPWAMWVDTGRRCWLHPKYQVEGQPIGTATMRIKLRADGYHVWAPPGKTR